jgi:type II secretory pathway component PulM
VFKDAQDQRDLQVFKEVRAPRELKVTRVLRASWVSRAIRVFRVAKGHLDLQVQLEPSDRSGQRVFREME